MKIYNYTLFLITYKHCITSLVMYHFEMAQSYTCMSLHTTICIFNVIKCLFNDMSAGFIRDLNNKYF